MSGIVAISIPEDVRRTAAKTVFDLENRIHSGEFQDPHSTTFSQTLVGAFEKAIVSERERCAELADYYAKAGIVEDPSGAAYYVCGALAGEIRNPVIRQAKPSVAIDDDDLPF
ncbi:hypothetical protein RMR10_004505 [Agrobacterium rosae]|uniref:hypothetical protein n=1 Tax=Agrobacterium rosae TaxID=1972867 RepID=UPI002A160049|nr:hypothetical protein [Agrobacterium rosae]MDX8315617.1 hypothetical protein [Agrobacterium rosae]